MTLLHNQDDVHSDLFWKGRRFYDADHFNRLFLFITNTFQSFVYWCKTQCIFNGI